MTDIEIAESVELQKINKIAEQLGIEEDNLIAYGKFKAKVDMPITPKKDSKLVLVTAINPTSAGIGKTTVSIGLADAMKMSGDSVCLALREPSLGPVFGIKGGATGGGQSQIAPMADINLHFNGDFHAITSANNLLCSVIDNHIFQGNQLDIDTDKIMFHRCLDVNDRALREVLVGNTKGETPRKDNFSITAASEIMAIMCLSTDIAELKRRLGNILVAFSKSNNPIFCRDLKCQDAMAILLKDTLMPNLVQTLAGTPALVHLGPFANIAHGCNSITATKLSMSLADYTITEAGFGADLGAEKFLDIKCRVGDLSPNAVVLVATIPAIKLHGGIDKEKIYEENVDGIKAGIHNLLKHVDIIQNVYGLPLVVTINKFKTDTQAEINVIEDALNWLKIPYAINDAWGQGGKGCMELAKLVKDACNTPSTLHYSYDLNEPVIKKIENISKNVYGASGVKLSDTAINKIQQIESLGMENFPVVIAKTQYSLSDDPKLIGAPENFEITIRDIEIRSGAEFIVALAGNMMLMPGLGKTPASEKMTISDLGKIDGLF
jgi:formate--tetrahydrofolate ligase